VSSVQLVPQFAPLHRYAPQLEVLPATQLPVPLQVLGLVLVEPAQLPDAHCVPEA